MAKLIPLRKRRLFPFFFFFQLQLYPEASFSFKTLYADTKWEMKRVIARRLANLHSSFLR